MTDHSELDLSLPKRQETPPRMPGGIVAVGILLVVLAIINLMMVLSGGPAVAPEGASDPEPFKKTHRIRAVRRVAQDANRPVGERLHLAGSARSLPDVVRG